MRRSRNDGIGWIYSLNCPIDKTPKYIGKTSVSIDGRFANHINNTRQVNKKSNWIKSLKEKGLLPYIEIVDEVYNNEINFWEQHYISLYRSWGFDLKNMTSGGDGMAGCSLDVRHKMSVAKQGFAPPWKGVKLSEEHKKKLSQAWIIRKELYPHPCLGQIRTSDQRKRISDSLIGRKLSENHKINIGKVNKGLKRGEEFGRKVSNGLRNSTKLKGRTVSEETKQKMRLAQSERRKKEGWY